MPHEVDEPLEGDGELRAPVVPRQLVDLVDDDPPKGPELIPHAPAREEDLERLRGRDQDVRGVAGLLRPLLRGGVPMADRDADTELLPEERHPPEHVAVQGPERRDVQAAHGLRLLGEDLVEDWEDRRFRLPDPRRGDDKDALPGHDSRHGEALGLGKLVEPELPERVENRGMKIQSLHREHRPSALSDKKMHSGLQPRSGADADPVATTRRGR